MNISSFVMPMGLQPQNNNDLEIYLDEELNQKEIKADVIDYNGKKYVKRIVSLMWTFENTLFF